MPLDLLLAIERPFPGLRPFQFEDSLLFFGREQHTRELLRRLATDRFLAVVGGSGSGKSSLVRAGLLPALYAGQLAGATTHWRIATMRPGADPLENLCDALAATDALGEDRAGDRSRLLRTTSVGLAEVVQNAGLAAGESLLVVVDQFEELFRFAISDETDVTAAFFVSSLLTATDRYDVPVYVVLTMRSDFLGECARFSGLAEALGRSQYLIPRLTREERRQAIERPLQLAGVTPTPSFVQQLLNDSEEGAAAPGRTGTFAGARPDPLPILQHALMKTFERWRRHGGDGLLTVGHYNDVGGMEKALDRHAEQVFSDLDEPLRAWAEKIFRCVTTIENGRQTRRPTRRASLFRIIGAAAAEQQAEVNAVLERFSSHDDSLLVVSNQDRIDIPHESLLWKWERLQGWVVAEAEGARRYRDVATAVIERENGRADFLRDPGLRTVLDVATRDAWNAAWAAQYRPGEPSLADVERFLSDSQSHQTKDRWLWRVALLLVTVGIAGSLYYWRESRNERVARGLLESRVADVEKLSQLADQRAREATLRREALETLSPGELTSEERTRFEEALAREKEARQAADSLRQEKAALTATGSDLVSLNEQLQVSLSRTESERQRLQASLSKREEEHAQTLAQLDVVRKERDTKEAELRRLAQEGDRTPNTSALPSARQRPRPIEGGTSVSLLNDWEREGTICCVVRDAKGKQYVLSHIWAMATIGASLTQPAIAKGGTSEDVIAKVTRFARIGSPPRNSVAIAELTTPFTGRQSIGGLLVQGTGGVRDGQAVSVVTSSGIISGTVVSSRRTIEVPTFPSASKVEIEAIIVNARVNRRDAGAPVLTADESRLVGLVGSGDGADQVYVLPITSVLKALDVELVP